MGVAPCKEGRAFRGLSSKFFYEIRAESCAAGKRVIEKLFAFAFAVFAIRRSERSAVGAPTLCPPGKRKPSF
jgi:hypothetical protein